MPQKKSKTPSDKTAKADASETVKKKKKTTLEAGEPAAETAHAAEGAADTKPAKAPRKRTVKKAVEAEGTAAPAVTKDEKPKKARAPRAKKAEAAPAEPAKAEHPKPETPKEHKPKAEHHAPHAHVHAPAQVKHTAAETPVKKIEEKPKAAPAQQPAAAPKQEPPKQEAKPAAPAPVAPPPPTAPAAPAQPKLIGIININEMITVRDLAEKMNLKPGDVLKKLLSMGSLATINQRLETDIATLLAHEFNYEAKFVTLYGEDEVVEEKEDKAKLKHRPPVVTVMGHVDHGKTSLLDAIRNTSVAKGEAGGITQHIGAYSVKTPKGEVTFLDTPGHEAFTAMRSRGAKITDLVILVVSATDGVMPQTVEAIDHARAANVPIIVAINKIDMAGANPEQIKQELNKYNLIPESWGGDTIMVEVSAKKNTNIDQLLEMVLLKAELMELKADPDKTARGAVIEARLDPKKGPVATVLIQSGTLHIGENFVVGTTLGKVRAMINDHGQRMNEVLPGRPVEILGITAAPQAGDHFIVVADERTARDISQSRQHRAKEDAQRPRHHLSLEDISAGKTKDLRVILKTDVQGSLGALRDSLEKLSTAEITLKVIHSGVGTVTESDVMLAASSDALIIGFNLRPEVSAQKLAEKEGVSIRIYRIIYEVISEIRAAMEGLLEPELKELVIGKAVVRQIFKSSKAGMIAGCSVSEGKIQRNARIRLLRDNKIVYEGTIASLRHLKDDVKEVDKGFECGIALEKFTDVKQGDILEAYINEKISRKLEP